MWGFFFQILLFEIAGNFSIPHYFNLHKSHHLFQACVVFPPQYTQFLAHSLQSRSTDTVFSVNRERISFKATSQVQFKQFICTRCSVG